MVDDADTTEGITDLVIAPKWRLWGETYALLPNTGTGGNANFYFDGGAQWNIGQHVIFSALIGSAAGHKSPDLTGPLELAFAY